MKTELICISCPNGCHLSVTSTISGVTVTGNKCKRGPMYAQEEITRPRRIVTAVARTSDAEWPCIPGKSTEPVPKRKVAGLLRHLYSRRITLPVERGDYAIEDYNGIRMGFTRSLPQHPAGPGR